LRQVQSRSCNARPAALQIPERKKHALRKRELVVGVFTSTQKHAPAKALTDVMVKFEGSEAFRQVTWVLIEELHTDGWHIGGEQFAGPRSLMGTLGRSKDVFEMIDGTPTSRDEFAAVLPPVNASERASKLHTQK
jgi:4-oxalocrotonate tautomerase